MSSHPAIPLPGSSRRSASYLVCGVLLMLFPYFVDGIVLTLIVGAALVIVPIALSKGWFDRS